MPPRPNGSEEIEFEFVSGEEVPGYYLYSVFEAFPTVSYQFAVLPHGLSPRELIAMA